MIVLPFGIFTPKFVSVKLQPMPKMTSALSRKSLTGFGFAGPPEPSDSGWVSGKPLLPPRLVVTGASATPPAPAAPAMPRPNARPADVHHRPLRAASIAAARFTRPGRVRSAWRIPAA